MHATVAHYWAVNASGGTSTNQDPLKTYEETTKCGKERDECEKGKAANQQQRKWRQSRQPAWNTSYNGAKIRPTATRRISSCTTSLCATRMVVIDKDSKSGDCLKWGDIVKGPAKITPIGLSLEVTRMMKVVLEPEDPFVALHSRKLQAKYYAP
ncbi:uncharacterized protein EI90DRAFT_3012449 [Cantharellus anzutake]|uniref:uncharacterized protein n=1 Tax=Cantharellus anzutake TaxID=1750568 RepID=UPI00190323C8|nr:uncharacterized protein EI90DRAFT_3012449 [Cantharellus anzutake]KAF8340654.1 hypothetical protein EI90DRAFT_3012449 [Cantharellus anzutake]